MEGRDPSDFSSIDELHQLKQDNEADVASFESGKEDEDIKFTEDRQHLPCPWYNQPKYSRFWHHYAAMQSWMQAYISMHRHRYCYSPYPSTTSAYPYMTNPYHSYLHHHLRTCSLQPNFNGQSHFNGQSQMANQYGERHSNHYPYNTSDPFEAGNDKYSHDMDATSNENVYEGESHDSMEIEVSQEMIQFFKTSQKFREERDKAKVKAAETTNSGSEDKKSKKKKKKKQQWKEMRGTDECRAPVERPDQGRRREMKVLYGKHSARIHGMETALQMQFDRNCDRLQPPLWPIVALKM